MARLLLADVVSDRALSDVAPAWPKRWACPGRESSSAATPRPEAVAIALGERDRRVATLLVPVGIDRERREQIEQRIAPALATLLAAAVERQRLGTEAVEAQALRRSDELKTALLRSVSHDLRTPLTSIAAAGEALGSPAITAAERDELAQVVSTESARLSRLVDQLLDLSRLESGVAVPRREWSSLEEICAGRRRSGERWPLRALLRPGAAARQRRRGAVRACARERPRERGRSRGWGAGVGPREAGGIAARAPGGRSRTGGPQGGPRADLRAVLPRQVRASDRSGSGLGLAIARGFITANGGSIRAESLPGQGTAIVIELPSRSSREVAAEVAG